MTHSPVLRSRLALLLVAWLILWAVIVATWMFDADGYTVGMPAAVFFLALLGPAPLLERLMTSPLLTLDSTNVVSETLLIPLYARATETRRPEPLLRDDAAAALVERLDYDFGRIRLSDLDRTLILLRVRQFDRWTSVFLGDHPGAAVVHIGCGLDTRFERVDDGLVEWYDLDLPEVIALRRELLPERPRVHALPGSAFHPEWMDAIRPTDPPPLVVAEGVLPYFAEAQVRGLALALRARFPGAELVCDAMTPLMARAHNLQLLISGMKARLHWGLRRPRDPETWAPGIRLLQEWYYFDRPEPRLKSSRWMRHVPPLGRGAGIFHYQLGAVPVVHQG